MCTKQYYVKLENEILHNPTLSISVILTHLTTVIGRKI